jgi:hypothetical protein
MFDDQRISKSAPTSQFTLQTLLIVISLLIVCLALIVVFRIRAVHRNAELERLAKVDEATMDQIVKDVEAVRTKLGRVPKDQTELEQLLGKSMPEVHPRGYTENVFYFRKTDNSYFLYFPTGMDEDRYYDSDNPKAGWLLRSD